MSDEHGWKPLSPSEVASIFARAEFPWWIAGGYAIDHAIGYPLRSHVDIDVLVLRTDQLRVQQRLCGWDCWASDPPGTLRPWYKGEVLSPPASDIWCRKEQDGPWQLQLMLDESREGWWYSRRHPLVTKPIRKLSALAENQIPCLAVEIQLFYKAKRPRLIDEIDFAATLPLLKRSQLAWLASAILTAYGPDNAWLSKIIERLSVMGASTQL
jgi:hypothetical protein